MVRSAGRIDEMMYGFDNGGFLGMGFGMLLLIAIIFAAGLAIGYLLGRSR